MVLSTSTDIQQAHDLIREMALAGHGPSEISRVLNERGYVNSRGTAYSVQHVHQLMIKQVPGEAPVLQLRQCRRNVGRAITRLYRAAQHDADAALIHGAYMKAREGGADTLDALDEAIAVA